MTNKALESLLDSKAKLTELREELKAHPRAKSRFGALIQTKLEEAGHWLDDLANEAIEEESKKNEP